MQLVWLRMSTKDSMEKHIDKFEELMETVETDMSEAYSYLLMTFSYSYR